MVKPFRLDRAKTSSNTWNKKPELDTNPILKAPQKLKPEKFSPVSRLQHTFTSNDVVFCILNLDDFCKNAETSIGR